MDEGEEGAVKTSRFCRTFIGKLPVQIRPSSTFSNPSEDTTLITEGHFYPVDCRSLEASGPHAAG